MEFKHTIEISPRAICAEFEERFQSEPLLVRAPGRINLIGEHTDYNNGFVMPAAIDREIWFALGASPDGRSQVYAFQYDEVLDIDLENPLPLPEGHWGNYLLGVIRQFLDKGYALRPFSCVFGGNIPQGAGLSSSAALECGFATALSLLHEYQIPGEEIARMAQWAEHHYAGVKCGIMDQFASTMSKKDHVILLDCASMDYEYVRMPQGDYAVVLCDTRVKHALVDSEYNTRRQECEAGVQLLQRYYGEVASLRDVTEDMLQKHRDEMPGKVFDRCLYVVGEIARVQEAAGALRRNDLHAFGEMMFDTHEGLSRLYEVSCEELDFLVAEARTVEGVIGARMMGGGFGGCTINLVGKDKVDGFVEEMHKRYRDRFGIDMEAWQVQLVEGAGRMQN